MECGSRAVVCGYLCPSVSGQTPFGPDSLSFLAFLGVTLGPVSPRSPRVTVIESTATTTTTVIQRYTSNMLNSLGLMHVSADIVAYLGVRISEVQADAEPRFYLLTGVIAVCPC